MLSHWRNGVRLRRRFARKRLSLNPVAWTRWAGLVWRVLKQMGRDDATHLAAGVAYYAMFSLFPLLLGLLAISGSVLASEGMEGEFVGFVTGKLPGSGELVADNVSQVIQFRGIFGAVAILGLLWSSSAVFGGISRAVNRAWGIRQDRPFYVGKVLHIGMALTVGVLFLLSTVATSVIEVFSNQTRDLSVLGQDILPDLGLANLALRAVPWVITFLIFLLVYRFVPNTKTYWRHIWPGALTAAVLFEVAKSLFVWYLDNLAIYNQVYGSLTSVMMLLLWIYLSALILILGAEISSEYGRVRMGTARGDTLEREANG